MESPYFNLDATREGVDAGRHRELVGGEWEAIGRLQFERLKHEGLAPHHRLLDVGCGSLRGGVHFVRYLEPGHYFGVDISQALLDAGYDIELANAGIQDRLPRENLLCEAEFNLPLPDATFDYAIAQSVFTHLTINRIRQCLARVARLMKPSGVFLVTFFERPDDVPPDEPLRHEPGGITTHDVSDPYHYSLRDLEFASDPRLWRMRYIGDWAHPRGQKLIAFDRLASPAQVRT